MSASVLYCEKLPLAWLLAASLTGTAILDTHMSSLFVL